MLMVFFLYNLLEVILVEIGFLKFVLFICKLILVDALDASS